MPCPRPLNFSHIADYVYDFCPLSDPDVYPSVLLCDAEHTSFHFGLCNRKFCACSVFVHILENLENTAIL